MEDCPMRHKLNPKEIDNLNRPITHGGRKKKLEKNLSNSYPSQKHQLQMVLQGKPIETLRNSETSVI